MPTIAGSTVLNQIQEKRDMLAQQAKLATNQIKASGLPSSLQELFLGMINNSTNRGFLQDGLQYLASELIEDSSSSRQFIYRQASKMLQTAVLIPIGAGLILFSDFKKPATNEAEDTPRWKNPRFIAKIAGYAILAFAAISTAKNRFDSHKFLTQSLSLAQEHLATAQKLMS